MKQALQNYAKAFALVTMVAVVLGTYVVLKPSEPNREWGLEAAVGWAALDLTDISLNKWAQGLVAANEDAASFQPFGSGPANARVTVSKDASQNGCAFVTATITPMYEGDIPGYDAKLGAVPRDTVSATREVCVLGDA